MMPISRLLLGLDQLEDEATPEKLHLKFGVLKGLVNLVREEQSSCPSAVVNC